MSATRRATLPATVWLTLCGVVAVQGGFQPGTPFNPNPRVTYKRGQLVALFEDSSEGRALQSSLVTALYSNQSASIPGTGATLIRMLSTRTGLLRVSEDEDVIVASQELTQKQGIELVEPNLRMFVLAEPEAGDGAFPQQQTSTEAQDQKAQRQQQEEEKVVEDVPPRAEGGGNQQVQAQDRKMLLPPTPPKGPAAVDSDVRASSIGVQPSSAPSSNTQLKGSSASSSSNQPIVPNDANYHRQWAMPVIQADRVWGRFTGGAWPLVCTIDTGVKTNHPDLAPNLHPAKGLNYITETDGSPEDDHGHGTHVTGTIAAVGNNAVGVAGVAFHSTILSCKAYDSGGGGDNAGVIFCIKYCSDHGAKIISMSAGGPGTSAILDWHVRNYCATGGLFVAAAGNNGRDVDVMDFVPATIDASCMLSVGASDRNNRLAAFSNFGRTRVHLLAPGEEIMSTGRGSSGVTVLSGTSMATPHVSGAAALLMARSGLELNGTQVKKILLDTVDRFNALGGRCSTRGRLNVRRAFAQVTPAPMPPPPPPPVSYIEAPHFLTVTAADLSTLQGAQLKLSPPAYLGSFGRLCYDFNLTGHAFDNRITSAAVELRCPGMDCKEIAPSISIYFWEKHQVAAMFGFVLVVLNPANHRDLCTNSLCYMPNVTMNDWANNALSGVTMCFADARMPATPPTVLEPITPPAVIPAAQRA